MSAVDGRPAAIDPERLRQLRKRVEEEIAAGAYHGAVYAVAHRGVVVAREAVGLSDKENGREARLDDVFALHSIVKPMVACLVATYVEDGALELTTPVADVIPEFGQRGKRRITMVDLLTHQSGLADRAPFADWRQNANLAAVVAWAAQWDRPRWSPGERVGYSPIVGHAVAAEMVRRLDGRDRTFSELLRERVLAPAGMTDSATWKSPELRDRCVPQRIIEPLGSFPDAVIESFDRAAESEGFEVPGAGLWGTVDDVTRFAEAIRREGEGENGRLLSPSMARLAVQNRTGDKPNEFQAFQAEESPFPLPAADFGLSFKTRGDQEVQHPFGCLVSPRTYGGLGLGSTMFWIDPDAELSFTVLTSGLIEEINSARRFERLSNIVAAALLPSS